jgi:hypothetical protein
VEVFFKRRLTKKVRCPWNAPLALNLSMEKAGMTSVEEEVAFWGCPQEEF